MAEEREQALSESTNLKENSLETIEDADQVIEFTSLIQATSTNPICQILCKHLKAQDRLEANISLTFNPVIRALSHGQNYKSFSGTLHNLPDERQLEIICWSVFWSEVVPILVENHSADAAATMQFRVSSTPYENYCLELQKCVNELDLLSKYDLSLIRYFILSHYENECE